MVVDASKIGNYPLQTLFTYDESLKRFFSRNSKIYDRAKRYQYQVLWQFGAYVRRVSMNSIKKAKTAVGLRGKYELSSLPGKPPVYHNVPRRYKDFIHFNTSTNQDSVVIGGVLFPSNVSRKVPKLLEYGGVAMVHGYSLHNHWKWIKTSYMATYLPRPHMRPAFDVAVKKLLPRLLKAGII